MCRPSGFEGRPGRGGLERSPASPRQGLGQCLAGRRHGGLGLLFRPLQRKPGRLHDIPLDMEQIRRLVRPQVPGMPAQPLRLVAGNLDGLHLQTAGRLFHGTVPGVRRTVVRILFQQDEAGHLLQADQAGLRVIGLAFAEVICRAGMPWPRVARCCRPYSTTRSSSRALKSRWQP